MVKAQSTYLNYLQRYFFKLYLFPMDRIGYRGLLQYVVVTECVIKVGDETVNGWAFNKMEWLKRLFQIMLVECSEIHVPSRR